MLLFVVTYDEQCCKEKGITQKCLGICHDERFEPLQSSGMESRQAEPQRLPPTSCDKFEYLKKACLVPIPERGGPNPWDCNYRFLRYKTFTIYYI